MPSKADLSIYQGDDYGAEVSVFNADGSAADLTGAAAKAQIRVDTADKAPAVVVEMTTVVSGARVTISLLKAETAKLTRPAYVWDLQLTMPSSAVVTILSGRVTVTPEVTRV